MRDVGVEKSNEIVVVACHDNASLTGSVRHDRLIRRSAEAHVQNVLDVDPSTLQLSVGTVVDVAVEQELQGSLEANHSASSRCPILSFSSILRSIGCGDSR